jgi:hypothetical protein
MNPKDNPSMHYKKEINYLVVINKLGLNLENGRYSNRGRFRCAATCDLHCIICILLSENRQTLSMGLSSQGYNGHFWDSEL